MNNTIEDIRKQFWTLPRVIQKALLNEPDKTTEIITIYLDEGIYHERFKAYHDITLLD